MLAFQPGLLDDSHWPRLSLRLPGALSSQGHAACLAALTEHLRRGQRLALIVDLNRVGVIPAEQRWRQAEWFERHEALLRERVLCAAILLSSPLVRLSICTILHFKPLRVPLAVFTTRQEAEAWVDERLGEEAGSSQAAPGPEGRGGPTPGAPCRPWPSPARPAAPSA